MARGRAIFRSHRAEFSFLVVVVTVIEVVDELDRDGSRLLCVENRHSEATKLEIGNDFEPPTIECVKPPRTVSSQGIPSCLLQVSQIEVLFTQARITTSQISPSVEGAPLDTRRWERRNHRFRDFFDFRCREIPAWIWDVEHIQNQTFLPGYSSGLTPINRSVREVPAQMGPVDSVWSLYW